MFKLTEAAERRKLTRAEDDYLAVLETLIEQYDDAKHPMPTVAPADRLKFLLSESGTTQKELAGILGVGKAAASM